MESIRRVMRLGRTDIQYEMQNRYSLSAIPKYNMYMYSIVQYVCSFICLEKPLANIGGEEGTQEEKNNNTTSVYKIKCILYITHKGLSERMENNAEKRQKDRFFFLWWFSLSSSFIHLHSFWRQFFNVMTKSSQHISGSIYRVSTSRTCTVLLKFKHSGSTDFLNTDESDSAVCT